MAARNGNLALVNDLIAAGADVNAKNEDGETPLYWPAVRGDTEIVEILRAAGADSHKSCVIS